MVLKLGMKHQGEGLYKVYINNDPGMTLTNLCIACKLLSLGHLLPSNVTIYHASYFATFNWQSPVSKENFKI